MSSRKPRKYQQIAQSILRELQQNDFTLTKTQLELAQEFGVNRLTIRHALDWLVRTHKVSKISNKRYSQGGLPKNVPQENSTPLIGLPLWVHSLASLDIAHMETRWRMTSAIDAILSGFGYQLDIQLVGPPQNPNFEKIEELCQKWDALIVEPMEGDSKLCPDHPFYSMRDRMVIFGTLQDIRHNSICMDFYSAGQLAIEEFVRRGARNILFTGRREESISHHFLRVAAAEDTASRYPGVRLQYAEGGFSLEAAYSAAKRFFLEGGKADAVLASTSYAAIGALRAMADLGIKVPEEIQLIAIGRTPLADYMIPRPTAIVSDPNILGSEIARMAATLIRQNFKPQPNILVPMHLIQGETTKVELSRQQIQTVFRKGKNPVSRPI